MYCIQCTKKAPSSLPSECISTVTTATNTHISLASRFRRRNVRTRVVLRVHHHIFFAWLGQRDGAKSRAFARWDTRSTISIATDGSIVAVSNTFATVIIVPTVPLVVYGSQSLLSFHIRVLCSNRGERGGGSPEFGDIVSIHALQLSVRVCAVYRDHAQFSDHNVQHIERSTIARLQQVVKSQLCSSHIVIV